MIFIQENVFENAVYKIIAICYSCCHQHQGPILLTMINFNPSMDK